MCSKSPKSCLVCWPMDRRLSKSCLRSILYLNYCNSIEVARRIRRLRTPIPGSAHDQDLGFLAEPRRPSSMVGGSMARAAEGSYSGVGFLMDLSLRPSVRSLPPPCDCETSPYFGTSSVSTGLWLTAVEHHLPVRDFGAHRPEMEERTGISNALFRQEVGYC
jgi:hypothetical protein